MPIFRPLTAHFGGSRGIFSYKTDKSAILCPGKTEVADFVSFKGSIVQGVIPLDKLESDKLSLLLQFLVDGLNTAPYQINGNNH